MGGTVCVRVLAARARDILESWQYSRREQDDAFSGFRVRISALALCDEDGEPLFEIADAESLEAAVAELGGKAGAVVDRVARRAKDVNGIGEAAEDEAGE